MYKSISFTLKPPHILPVALLLTVAAVLCLVHSAKGEWSEPIQLTDFEGRTLDADYSVSIDDYGNIHLACQLQRPNNRVLYIKYDPHGIMIGDPIMPFGDIDAYHPWILTDDDNSVHYFCLSRINGRRYIRYANIDQDGDFIAEPCSLVLSFVSSVSPESWYYYFRRSDGTFVYASPNQLFNEEDSSYYRGVAYFRFNDQGEAIGDPHLLWNDEEEDGTYFNFKTAMDNEDNLHFVWRLNQGFGDNTWYYASVSSDDEIIADRTRIQQRNEERGYSVRGLVAATPNAIFLRMVDGREEDEPLVAYMQKLNSEGESVFYADIIEHDDGNARIVTGPLWNDRIYFFGKMSLENPEISLQDFFLVAVDTTGEVVEEPEVAMSWRWRASIPDHFLRAADTLSMFFHERPGGHPEDRRIMMIQKVVDNNSVSDNRMKSDYTYGILTAKPNPFNSSTTISYSLPISVPVSLRLYDLAGREIRTLVEGKKEAGVHRTMLNAVDMPSGLYFVRLEAAGEARTTKVMLVR